MKNISVWEDTVKTRNYPKLNNNLKCDVLIVGGGITGVSSLYHLKNSKLKVILVEQNKIGFSVTGKSTGKLSYLQNDLIDKIRFNLGDASASKYLQSQIEGISIINNIINYEHIKCDLECTDSYLYTNKDCEINKLKSLECFLNKNNIKTYKANNTIVKNKYMFKVTDTYNFHPLKFIYGLLNNYKFEIYENTRINKINKYQDKYICYFGKYKIDTKYIILASHYPYFLFPFLFPIKASLEKSYISYSKYKNKPISLISYSNPFISIRNHKNNLIYLSNSHSLENDVCDRVNYNELLKKISDLKLQSDYLWSNIDIITNDGLPYIGKIKDNLLIGTGYNTWGLTNGVLAGKILSDIILNKENEYSKLFNPNRINCKQISGIFNSSFKTLLGYINGINNCYDIKLKCPHIGCPLIYNELENTFDCPCHGSRFNKYGKCISGPANKDIKKSL